jgi:hypothetical protein
LDIAFHNHTEIRMRYEPHNDESLQLPTMTDAELLEYFLYRVFETDEVWSLRVGGQPVTREVDGHKTLPVWPYKRYAEEAAVGDWEGLPAIADSVDYFTYQTLDKSARQGITIEIMPRQEQAGCLITPQRFFGMLENMMEARDDTVGD